MTQVPKWVQDLTEEVMGRSPVEIGKRYLHPSDGLIEITGGQYWGTHGLSNFWYWKVLATGEIHHGYGADWPEAGTHSDACPDPCSHDNECPHGRASVRGETCPICEPEGGMS